MNLIQIAEHSRSTFYQLRWGKYIACPKCGSLHIYNPEAGKLHICADCDNRFSDTSNTIFHSTKLPLNKWLVAIYMFLSQSRGISSYNLGRMIGVSQPTAWRMLNLLRIHIKHDLKNTDTAIIDEVYLGSDWKFKPAKEKFKHVEPPKWVWNLKGKDLKQYYRSQISAAASRDKIHILGISCYNERSLILQPYDNGITRSLVKSKINAEYANVSHWVSDQSKLYWWMDEEPNIKHSVCDHANRLYSSSDGYSSNRLEGAFSHLKRMRKGTYVWFSRKFAAAYLNEFSWRWSNFDLPIESKMESFFNFLV